MNNDDSELQALVADAEATIKTSHHQPMFEVFTTMFSILFTISLFIYPEFLSQDVESYVIMTEIMTQTVWAVIFFIASMMKAIGLLIDSRVLRISGLIISIMLYLIISISFAVMFPNILSIVFGVMAVFTAISVPLVKFTTIKYKKSESKEER